MNKIFFNSAMQEKLLNPQFFPSPSSKEIPKWFSEAEKYEKDEFGNDIKMYHGGRLPTFKACPALLDVFTIGYVLKTPAAIQIVEKDGNLGMSNTIGFEQFCGIRPPMKGFPTPEGYHSNHFHWWPNWATELPEGYSALYLHPINRFDLPFTTVAGIIDSDKMTTAGLMPFFLKKDFTGIIPAGTPYAQIIPFKREDWEMKNRFFSPEETEEMYNKNSIMFRVPEGGVYKKKIWSRKRYQ